MGGPGLQKFLSGTHSFIHSFPLCSCGLTDGSRVLTTLLVPQGGLSTSLLLQAPESECPHSQDLLPT